MKNIHTTRPNQFHTRYVVDYPLADQTIITLHKLFLTNGYHAITVSNRTVGHTIMQTVLSSLGHYQTVAVATPVVSSPLVIETNTQTTFIDIYTELINNGHNNYLTTERLNTFFIEQLYCDFMWIEMNFAADESSWWIKQCDYIIRRLGFDNHMPIIYVLYAQ